MTETCYQRRAREIAERQAKREAWNAARLAPKRKRAKTPYNTDRNANHIDGYDRDDLGLSPDY